MPTIHALTDNMAEPKSFGKLVPLDEDFASKKLYLKKHIEVSGMGSYNKTIVTPMYTKEEIKKAFDMHIDDPTESNRFLGYVFPNGSCDADGVVERVSGGHIFKLPFYTEGYNGGIFKKIYGYLPLEDGFVAVAGPRYAVAWIGLAVVAAAAAQLIYLAIK